MRFNLDMISHRNKICYPNEHYSSYVTTQSKEYARNEQWRQVSSNARGNKHKQQWNEEYGLVA